ncbi:Major Facilitator Superfamily (MFS), partial [Achlya hypogyna]
LCHRCIPKHYNLPLANYAEPYDDLAVTTPTSPVLLDDAKSHGTSTFFGETTIILKNPIFLGATFGLAAFTFTMNGMISFAPAILIGFGLMDESIASTAFGALVVVAGLVGAPASGYLQDMLCRGRESDRYFRLRSAALQLTVLITTGVALLLVSLACMRSKIVFFALLFTGFLCVFATQTVTTIVLLMCVDQSHRGFAMGLSTFLLHLFGDIPAGVVLGALKDFWAPHCGSKSDASGKDILDPKCHLDKDGLRYTLAFAYGWLLWCVLCYGFAFIVACKWYQEAKAKAGTPRHGLMCS